MAHLRYYFQCTFPVTYTVDYKSLLGKQFNYEIKKLNDILTHYSHDFH